VFVCQRIWCGRSIKTLTFWLFAMLSSVFLDTEQSEVSGQDIWRTDGEAGPTGQWQWYLFEAAAASGHNRAATPALLRTNRTAPIFWMRVVACLYFKSYSDRICIHKPDSEVKTTTAWTVPCSQEFKSEDAIADKRWLRDHKLRFQSLSDDWP